MAQETRFIDKLEGKGLLVRKIEGKNVYVFSTEKSISATLCLELGDMDSNHDYLVQSQGAYH